MRRSRIIQASQPELVTVPNVELLEAGEDWQTSTGVFTFTAEHLVSCIQSQDDPAVRSPVLKLGHTDPRFDGQPTFGRLDNLRLSNNGQTLIGDYVGVPVWLAQVMYTAFPRRSIEGMMDFDTRTGNTWPMVLTGLALLGDAYPAIETLEDIQAMWGSTPPKLYPTEDVGEIAASAGSVFYARKVDEMAARKKVAAAAPVKASANLDEVRRAYYDSLGAAQNWWWIREIRVNPITLIVDDDEGGLYEVPVNVSASDEITFGEPTKVIVQYVAASGAPIAASHSGQLVAATHQTPEESGRNPRVDTDDSVTLSDGPVNPTTEEDQNMFTAEELAALGLPPDATDEQIKAALLGPADDDTAEAVADADADDTAEAVADDADATEAVADDDTASEVTVPDGMVLVDAASWDEMRAGVAAAQGLVERQAQADRDAILDDAIRAGKFPLGRRDHYAAMLSADPLGAKALLATMEPGLVPTTEIGGDTQATEIAAAANTYPASWQRSIDAARRTNNRAKAVND